jgi:hypothetical protein
VNPEYFCAWRLLRTERTTVTDGTVFLTVVHQGEQVGHLGWSLGLGTGDPLA